MKTAPLDPVKHLDNPEVIQAYVEEQQTYVRELLAEIEEQARLNGIGAERELALRAERDRLRAVLRALVERIDQVHQDPAYVSVWTIHLVHCGQYQGPTYSKELDEAYRLLKEIKP